MSRASADWEKILFQPTAYKTGRNAIVLLACLSLQNLHVTAQSIPSPRPNGWVVDQTDRLRPDAITAIDNLVDEVAEKYSGEIAVVMISSTDGKNHRQFATDLFNQWGIGSRFQDNGILIFAAMDDRAAEIVLGDGIDTQQNIDNAEVIMDHFLTNNFSRQNYGGGMYETARACATRIFGIATLESPTEIPLDPGARPRSGRRRGNGGAAKLGGGKGLGRFGTLPFVIGFAVIGGLALLIGGRYYSRYRRRNCDECGQAMVRLDEQQDDQFLSEPEVLEERLGSVDYDVWACYACEYVDKLRYGAFFTRYSTCPECQYRTKIKYENTLVAATTTRRGRIRVTERCEFCSYKHSYTYSTPKIVESSSSSSSSSAGFGGWGGSSGGFGSGGSGFGGGSSSGAGASGRW